MAVLETGEIVCDKCDVIVSSADYLDDRGRCTACTICCGDCSETVDADTDLDAYGRCDECSIRCSSCDEAVNRRADLDYHGHCTNCVIVCDVCENHLESESGLDAYGRCAHCSFECDACGEVVLPLTDGLCAACYHGDDEEEEILHDYGYEPPLTYYRSQEEDTVFYRGGNGRSHAPLRYFGVEIELEFGAKVGRGHADREAEIEKFAADPGAWYWKTDSSLTNGAEAVSMPATLRWWQTADLTWIQRARDSGCRAYDTESCGFHVHVSRCSLSQLTIYKLLRLFADNARWVSRISRRRRPLLDKYAAIDRAGLAYKVKGGDHSRYRAINLTNYRTIEFRIFRGSLHVDSVRRNLFWIAAICLYAHDESLGRLSPERFHTWLKINGEAYFGRKANSNLVDWSEQCA